MSRVDEGLFKEKNKYTEEKYVVSVVRFLAEIGLQFRRQNEEVSSVSNGNFLGTIELLQNMSVSGRSLQQISKCKPRCTSLPLVNTL
jgi:hypothetical protein